MVFKRLLGETSCLILLKVLLGSTFVSTTVTNQKFVLLIEEPGPSHVPTMGIDYDEYDPSKVFDS